MTTPMSHGDLDAMNRALLLAEQGLYSTMPNPRVGCVIVSERGDVVGEGFHWRAGEPHAEINALTMAGNKAQGATAYVTLEPCNHHGRTGPCSQALIDAGVSCVVYAMQDPNPLVAGQGLARLRNAGIHVRGSMLQAQAVALNLGFIKRMLTGRPYARCKLAMSLDGRTAMASGESQWITGAPARLDVQKMRARSCSIITGSGTVINDNPQLSVRAPELGELTRQPLRVVVDSQLRTPLSANILLNPSQTVIASACNAQKHAGANVWPLGGKSGQVDLHALLQKLGAEQHNEVLIEAGPTLAGAFLQAGLIDEIVVYMAGKLMGSTGKPLFELPIEHMRNNIDLTLKSMQPIGQDWRIVAIPHNTLQPVMLEE